MTKIKEVISDIWGYLVLILGGAVAIMMYLLNLKDKKLEAAKAEIALVNTQKEADVLEVQIKQQMQQHSDNKKALKTLEEALSLLEEKRENLKDERSSDEEKENYWNK